MATIQPVWIDVNTGDEVEGPRISAVWQWVGGGAVVGLSAIDVTLLGERSEPPLDALMFGLLLAILFAPLIYLLKLPPRASRIVRLTKFECLICGTRWIERA